MFRFAATAAACGLLTVAGCDSTPDAPKDPDASSKTKAPAKPKPASRPGTLTPVDPNAPANGPKRLEAKRAPETSTPPAAPAPAPPAPAATAAPVPAPAPAATAAPVAPAAAPAQDAHAPTAAQRAAAQRMLAENDAKRRAEAEAAAARAAARDNPDSEHGSWSVLLATATGEDSAATAATIRDEIARRYPPLKDAFVRTNTRGSIVLVGHFDGPQDPAAKAALKVVKEQVEGTLRAFPRAMLTRMGAAADQGPPGPNDLRSVRKVQPTKTLYTLQVAVWSAFGTDEVKMGEIKRAAENYCRQLRAQGDEAYYFHDFDSHTSTVTVGVFGDGAYDPRSTLYAPEVEAAMKKFPKHLVNGEELLIPADPHNPGGRTMPQAPRLVEIPKM
jgi:hypothetical protein